MPEVPSPLVASTDAGIGAVQDENSGPGLVESSGAISAVNSEAWNLLIWETRGRRFKSSRSDKYLKGNRRV